MGKHKHKKEHKKDKRSFMSQWMTWVIFITIAVSMTGAFVYFTAMSAVSLCMANPEIGPYSVYLNNSLVRN